jgi:magnesium chelatase subunit H
LAIANNRNSNPEDRRVVPEDVKGRKKFKVVYVVLESQYQSSMTVACKRINAAQVPCEVNSL